MSTRKFAGHTRGADSQFDTVIDSSDPENVICRPLSQKGWEAIQNHVPPFFIADDRSFQVKSGMEQDLRKKMEAGGLKVQLIAAKAAVAAD